MRSFGGDPGFAFDNLRLVFGRTLAESRSIRITLALNADPDSLQRNDWNQDYLIGLGVPESATIDPFTDEPMIVKRENDRWLVYSRGKNLVDDGGDAESDHGVLLME